MNALENYNPLPEFFLDWKNQDEMYATFDFSKFIGSVCITFND